MAEQPDGLITIQDFIRWGASRFARAGLHFGHGTDNALDEAAQIVLHCLQLGPLLPQGLRDCRLTAAERVAITDLIERRIAERIPAAYLTGSAWFAGLEFYVNPNVLVPRSPIAELIEAGFEPWIDGERVGRVLDLCTGSGCIGIATAVHLPDADVDLVDIDTAALEVARSNVARHGVEDRVRVLESNLFSALAGNRYDVIVSNPPYVAAEEYRGLPAEYLREPELALLAADEGLSVVLGILRDAGRHLSEQGILVLEVGSAASALDQRLPQVPWTWIEFERGGEGVLLLTREQIAHHQQLFDEASDDALEAGP